MVRMAPPPPLPPLPKNLAEDEGRRWMRLRLWQLWMTTLTVLVTAWFFTLGALPGLLAVMVSKHILVAILIRGLSLDGADRE
jgi:hypothetical protein